MEVFITARKIICHKRRRNRDVRQSIDFQGEGKLRILLTCRGH